MSMNEAGWCSCDETKPFQFETHEEWGAHVLAALREAHTITTREQLDALPDKAIILTSTGSFQGQGGPWQKDPDGYSREEAWMPGGYDVGYTSERVAEELPALLLWHPDWADQ